MIKHARLVRLNLNKTGLAGNSEIEFKNVTEAIAANTTLRNLYMEGSNAIYLPVAAQLGERGGMFVAQALLANAHIVDLNIGNCKIEASTYHQFEMALQCSWHLKLAGLAGNGFSSEQLSTLLQIVAGQTARINAALYFAVQNNDYAEVRRIGNPRNWSLYGASQPPNFAGALCSAVHRGNNPEIQELLLNLTENPYGAFVTGLVKGIDMDEIIDAYAKFLAAKSADGKDRTETDVCLMGLGLSEIPHQLSKLDAITRLDLRFNRLRFLPRWENAFPNLQKLELEGRTSPDPKEILSI